MDNSLLINQKKAEKEVAGIPNVTSEVERWGGIIGWLRAKEYTPEMVRAMVLSIEEKEKEDAESDT